MWRCRGSQALEVEDDGDGGIAGAPGVRLLGEEGEVVKAKLLNTSGGRGEGGGCDGGERHRRLRSGMRGRESRGGKRHGRE